MKEKIFEQLKKHQILLLTLLVALIGFVVFIFIYGFEVIDVTNEAWLYSAEDLTQHYYGWVFYRNADWTFPIGLFNTLSYPEYSSVVFTDSIPLFAILFKIISGILPETFQYLGIFGVICYMLQGVFAFTLLRKFVNSKLFAILRKHIFHYFSMYYTKDVYTYSIISKLFITYGTMLVCIQG